MTDDTSTSDRTRWEELVARGEELGEEDAERLERRLQLHPDNTEVRALLLGYYGRLCDWESLGLTRERWERLHRHWLWIAERAPWLPLQGHGTFPMFIAFSGDDARALWRKALDEHPRDIDVVRNALFACGPIEEDDTYLDDVLDRALVLVRERPARAMRIAHELEFAVGVPSSRPSAARKALEIALVAYAAEPDPTRRIRLVWLMRGFAGSVRRQDLVALFRDAQAAEKLWHAAVKDGRDADAREHLRAIDARVADAARAFEAEPP